MQARRPAFWTAAGWPEQKGMVMLEALAHELDADFGDLPVSERLRQLRAAIPGRIVFTTSLGLEDQVLTHLIAEAGLDITLVTLDTGRLFPETLDLLRQTEKRYHRPVTVVTPFKRSVDMLMIAQGADGFRHSVAARKSCCEIRKVEPLGRALAGASAWVTGLRADQSAHRGGVSFASHDMTFRLLKVSPLLDWTREQAVTFATEHDVPVNPLHAKGFLSIGCAPCTRAVQPGEPERAGRWWWEDEMQKECGLHVDAAWRLVRARTAFEVTP
jgi:phosphoadenosine phosphosulfate reductase